MRSSNRLLRRSSDLKCVVVGGSRSYLGAIYIIYLQEQVAHTLIVYLEVDGDLEVDGFMPTIISECTPTISLL